jgi:hypothetical protein
MGRGEIRLAHSRDVHAAGTDGLVQVDVAVANLEIEATVGIDTHPRFVMNRRALATVVRERNQLSNFTLKTFRTHPFFHLSPSRIELEPSISPAFSEFQAIGRRRLRILS